MFGASNPFGQSTSSSPFGSQSVFGQTSTANNNPFAPKPFGSTTPFGSPQTGSSIFGGTATGMFGAPQTSSPFSSASAFGVSSSPAMPSFGASSTPAFGNSSSAFGGSSAFGQKPAFGGFGSTNQTSPFGSTTQQSQPAFGSGLFGSTTPFGGSSQSAFGATSTPAFGSTSTPAFGATTTPSFGSTSSTVFGSTTSPTFGNTTPAFGVSSAPVFGSGSAFGTSNTSVFGQSSTPAFGSSTTPGFGASSAVGFGSSAAPAFGSASSSPAFGAPTPTTPSFSFSGASFGQSTSPFGSSTPFGNTPSFGGQSSSFGAQTTASAFGNTGFGQSAFGGQRGGSRVAPYTATTETESSGSTGQPGKLESISAMPVYKDKSHEELRWEDYQLGDKGGPAPLGASSAGMGFSSPITPSPALGQSSANPFSTASSANPFASKSPTLGSSPAFSTSSFPTPSPNPFQSNASFGVTSTSAFTTNTSPSPFGSQSAFGSTPSLFNSTTSLGSASPFSSSLNFNTSQASPFQSATTSLGQTGSAFGQTGSAFGQTGSAFGQTGSAFGQTGSAFGQSSIFGSSPGFGGSLFPSSTSMMPSTNTGAFAQPGSQSTPFQPSQPSQGGAFSFNNFGQSQTVGISGLAGLSSMGGAGLSSMGGQSNIGQPSTTPSSFVQQVPATNPFGTLPAMPQMSIGRAGTTPSVQYGISSMPVVEKPAPVRISSLLTSRHMSQRRIKLPARKYNPKLDGPKVPFFSDEEETPSTPKADALFIPRENPRALVIRPVDQWPSRTSSEKTSPLKEGSTAPVHENGKFSEAVDDPSLSGSSSREKNKNPVENGVFKERVNVKLNQKANGVNEDHSVQKEETYMTLSGHRAGEAAIVYEHGADIEALMPKLRHSDYYTEPRIQELAAKERAEPGFCRHVKDFVVGRHGCGSIKFLGETDVRRLDLESVVQFNNREVIVYLDDSKKPPVGQDLNKPAVVTLLNIKCYDKKTGTQVTEGPKIEKYKEMLKRKAEDQGAEFVSYDPVKGEWKFKVSHFSKYKLCEEDEDDSDLDACESGC